jgi:hypothetical protein
MAIRAMSSKQNLQLVSALAEALERSRQNRSETLSAISALRSHVDAVSACHKSKASDQILPHQTIQSLSERQPSENYNDLLISKYREKCSKMQEELYDTKARLSATESHVQHLEVQWIFDLLFNLLFNLLTVRVVLHSVRSKFVNSRRSLMQRIKNCTGNLQLPR